MLARTPQQKYDKLKDFLVSKTSTTPRGWELVLRCKDTIDLFEAMWMNDQVVYDKIDKTNSGHIFYSMRTSVLRDVIGQLYMLSGADSQSKEFISLLSENTMNEIKSIADKERIEWIKTLDKRPPIKIGISYSCSFPVQEEANDQLIEWDKTAFSMMNNAESNLRSYYKTLGDLRNRHYFHVTDHNNLPNTNLIAKDISEIGKFIWEKFSAMTLFIDRSSWGDYHNKDFKTKFKNMIL